MRKPMTDFVTRTAWCNSEAPVASVTVLGREHLTSKQPLARPVVSKRSA
jgi:hypothetical protein